MKPMSSQLSLAALASVLALAALCFQTPAIVAGGGAGVRTPATAMMDITVPALELPSLLPR